ncbi:Dipeptidyl-peptidase 6 [Roseivivax jejudonensis]|uniref:Dipeptidyl-peptidase 6 n=1 Tax=Roseivivax jejudonensis TaxID=1529041 RepID=A0A1X6YIY8_9RHOB|nr:NlpC/P60 family protein [Roseivivax jejudonensis]SLN22626.1 Dipeptidyl-peptidase 6 [Roseivivax jejudonensis]
MDRRLTPANAHVAATRLRGTVEAPRFTDGTPARVVAGVCDLCAAPGGARDRQLLRGAAVTVYERRSGWAFVEAAADGYVGYVTEAALGDGPAPTHRVCVRQTHSYPDPDMKTREIMALSIGAGLAVRGQDDRFAETDAGHVPLKHLAPLDAPEADPVAVAARLVGTPYLWGGNSAFGIDCSGLVQIALWACGRDAPGDSDLQEAMRGDTLDDGDPLRRGDLLFWRGHVAWVSDDRTLLHANAHAMAVAYEPIDAAIDRIAAQGDGPVTRRLRPAG